MYDFMLEDSVDGGTHLDNVAAFDLRNEIENDDEDAWVDARVSAREDFDAYEVDYRN